MSRSIQTVESVGAAVALAAGLRIAYGNRVDGNSGVLNLHPDHVLAQQSQVEPQLNTHNLQLPSPDLDNQVRVPLANIIPEAPSLPQIFLTPLSPELSQQNVLVPDRQI